MTGVLTIGENLETDTLHGMDVEGRDWGDAFQAKKCQRWPAHRQQLGERQGRDSLS